MTDHSIQHATEPVNQQEPESAISAYALDMAAIALLGGMLLYRNQGHQLGWCEYRQLARVVVDTARLSSGGAADEAPR